jgi:S-adenosylmethionine uptake transporter
VKTYPTDHASPAIPFLVATGAIMVFTTMDGVVKSLPASIPVIQIVAMRFAFGIPMVLAAMRLTGGGWPSLASWKANAPRGLLSMGSTLLFFTALRHLPFAEALALSYVGPLMVALMAAAVLGERLRLGVIGPILALFGVTGHFLLVWAFGRAQAGVLAVVDYLALPYAALLGFAFFAEIPTPAMWAGAAFIVVACLIVTRMRR